MPNQQQCQLSRTVVWFLGINATLLSGGIIAITLISKTPDAAFFALAGGALGNLGNLVMNSQQGQRRADAAVGGQRGADERSSQPPAGDAAGGETSNAT